MASALGSSIKPSHGAGRKDFGIPNLFRATLGRTAVTRQLLHAPQEPAP